MKKRAVLLATAGIALLLAACSDPVSNNQPVVAVNNSSNIKSVDVSVHVRLGIPKDADTTNDYIIYRNQYALSYNPFLNVPNWVSWNLNQGWYGDVERYQGNFIADTSLPQSFYRVKHSDYTNSGYDRGHMVRSEERTQTVEDNKSTFILTNILPQRPDLNQGVWLDLEYACERLCKTYNKELYIVAGGVFTPQHTTINGKVAVPDSCFKIVIVLDRGRGLNDVTTNTQVYAVIMPNINGIRSDDWKKYARTIDDVERATGYDFLSSVPASVQEVIEAKLISFHFAETPLIGANPISGPLRFSPL